MIFSHQDVVSVSSRLERLSKLMDCTDPYCVFFYDVNGFMLCPVTHPTPMVILDVMRDAEIKAVALPLSITDTFVVYQSASLHST